jgi:hypothetical protein
MNKPYVATVTLRIPLRAENPDDALEIFEDYYGDLTRAICKYSSTVEITEDDMEEEQ